MNRFFDWLEQASERDTRVRAVLRRSLSFPPGTVASAYPYVEPFVRDDDSAWRRNMLYLVAGLWAAHWREGRTGPPVSIGKACASHQEASGSTSTERRFINLLDADPDQLPHRLRQLVGLLKDHSLDFEAMLKGLVYWQSDQKRTQNAWAKDFYRNIRSHKTIANAGEEQDKETES